MKKCPFGLRIFFDVSTAIFPLRSQGDHKFFKLLTKCNRKIAGDRKISTKVRKISKPKKMTTKSPPRLTRAARPRNWMHF